MPSDLEPTRSLAADPAELDSTLPTVETAPAREHADSTSMIAGRAIGRGASRATGTRSAPADAMFDSEVRRMHLYAGFVAAICVSAAAAVSIVRGDPSARAWHLAGIAAALSCALWIGWASRDRSRYRPAYSTAFSAACAIALSSGYHFWGELSAVLLIVPLGIYAFGLCQRLSAVIVPVAICAGAHLALTVSVAAGWLDDVGLVGLRDPRPLHVVVALLLVHFVLLFGVLIARQARATILASMHDVERAAQEIARRSALLAEAKEELQRARRVGGPGRFTQQALGPYRLGNLIGRGAMGDVYEAAHVDSGEEAAIKLLNAGAISNADLVARFQQEARIVASLRTEHVVRVLELPEHELELPCLAMERLRGETLGALLRARAMPVGEVIEMMTQVARGVGAAHAAGVVHRDLKPDNLFRHQPASGHRLWKVLDFGISKLVDSGASLTRGKLIGTPAYMSPEQARADRVDHRTDVYALGVIAYRALTGRPAFAGSDAVAVLQAIAHNMPPPPSQAAGVDPSFDSVLSIAMAKSPADRFDSAEQLASALRAAAAGALPDELRQRAHALSNRHPWSAKGRAVPA